MTWKQEDKEEKQRIYGLYCEYCRKNNLNIVPYYLFNTNMYKKLTK